MPYLTVLADFRAKVRDSAREKNGMYFPISK